MPSNDSEQRPVRRRRVSADASNRRVQRPSGDAAATTGNGASSGSGAAPARRTVNRSAGSGASRPQRPRRASTGASAANAGTGSNSSAPRPRRANRANNASSGRGDAPARRQVNRVEDNYELLEQQDDGFDSDDGFFDDDEDFVFDDEPEPAPQPSVNRPHGRHSSSNGGAGKPRRIADDMDGYDHVYDDSYGDADAGGGDDDYNEFDDYDPFAVEHVNGDAEPYDTGAPSQPSYDDSGASDVDTVARIASEGKSRRLREDLRENDNRETRRSHVNTMQGQTDVVKKNRFIRIGVYVLLVAILGVAVWRAVTPVQTLTTTDVQNVVAETTGDYGFPVQSGEGIAKQFITAFVESQGDPDSQKILNMYYNGVASNSDNTSTSLTNMSSSNIKQTVDKGPYVFNIVQRSAYSCNYEVAVQVSQTRANDGSVVTDDNGKKQSKMEYFMVGVYYNPDTNKFGVSEDSPIVMPETQAYSQQIIPDSDLPGDGVEQQDAKTTALTEMLTTYMNAYAASDLTTLGIVTNNSSTARTKQGLNGLYTVDGNIDYTVYGDGAANKYKVVVTVNLKDTVDKDSSVTYKSKYTLSVVKSGEKYYVTDIRPFAYTVSESTQKQSESVLGSSSSSSSSSTSDSDE